jgi:GT2 family glycosyltransferase
MEASEPQPLVSVVIPARNAASTLGEQLDALTAQAPAAGAEIIVVDNNSSDATAEMVEAWARRVPYVHLVRCDRIGVNPARNAGVRAARADRILVCDSDDVVGDDWIAAMVRALDEHRLVGGVLDPKRLNSRFVQDVKAENRNRSLRPRLMISQGRPYAVGCNFAFHREVFDAVGGFDESFPIGGGDEVDFCLRAQDAGYAVALASDAVVHVRWRTGLRELMQQAYRSARGTSYLYHKQIETGSRAPQALITKAAMFKAYWRRLRSVGNLTERPARWRLAIRLAWIAGSIASAPRTRVLV